MLIYSFYTSDDLICLIHFTDEGVLLDKIVERVVKNVNKKRLAEAAKDSENTALLEEEKKGQQQQRGIVEVLFLCIEKLQIDWVGGLLAVLVGLLFLVFWTTAAAITLTNDPFGIIKKQKGQYVDINQGRQRLYFHDGQVEFSSCATVHPIGWQFVFALFMNMVVVYIM